MQLQYVTVIFFLIAFASWAILHSLTASTQFKIKVRAWLGERVYAGLYRLAYNIISLITFAPVLYLGAAIIPDIPLWTYSQSIRWLLLSVQFAAAIGFMISLIQTDLLRFAGIGQFIRYIMGKPDINPRPTFVTGGFHRYVRHPIYAFGIVILWLSPIVTWQTLALNVASTFYFWIGSYYEERKMAETFGDLYLQYQQQVPRLNPFRRLLR